MLISRPGTPIPKNLQPPPRQKQTNNNQEGIISKLYFETKSKPEELYTNEELNYIQTIENNLGNENAITWPDAPKYSTKQPENNHPQLISHLPKTEPNSHTVSPNTPSIEQGSEKKLFQNINDNCLPSFFLNLFSYFSSQNEFKRNLTDTKEVRVAPNEEQNCLNLDDLSKNINVKTTTKAQTPSISTLLSAIDIPWKKGQSEKYIQGNTNSEQRPPRSPHPKQDNSSSSLEVNQ